MKVYNTLSQKLEDFEPLQPPKVSIYVCGPTVYDDSHIGHGRAYVSYDMMVRYLRYKGYDVTYVRNITDIEDKIIKKALEQNISTEEVSKRNTETFHADLNRLGLQPPDIEPRATETVQEIIDMIEALIEKNHAYASQGDVYFSVKSCGQYGRLSKKKIDDLKSGARVLPGEQKKDPLDFALWKASKEGEPSWDSPWGKGRPGWHIECSAMAKKFLGPSIDIHSGGQDLIFPHHENEIAQSECANQAPFSKYWLHNGLIRLSKEKMSKSLGNTVLLKDLRDKYHPEVTKFYLLSSHYRSPMEFCYEDIDSAQVAFDRLVRILYAIPEQEFSDSTDLQKKYEASFQSAMDEDFNTPKAISVLFDLVREANKLSKKKETLPQAIELRATLKKLGGVLGFFSFDPKEYFCSIPGMENVDVEKIESMIAKRSQARREKDFEAADEIRSELENMGITLEDSPEGTSWRKNIKRSPCLSSIQIFSPREISPRQLSSFPMGLSMESHTRFFLV